MFIKLFVIGVILLVGPLFGIELVIVRHGETNWNLQKRLQGHTDIELNATGISQAQNAGEQLKSEKFDVVYTSDLKRANVTGKLIVKKLETAPKGIFTDERIREKSFGEFEGQHFPNADLKRAVLEGAAAKGAETKEEFREKVVSFLSDLRGRYSDDVRVLIVTHGGVVRVLMKESGRKGYVEVPNGSISRFRLTSQGKLESFESARELSQATPHG